ncbi:MAG: hypothetical protein Q4D98_03460 [Planctomycetia bacterium]|nr:hypothetical protein [Planctomycetia bacterium]
MAVVTLMEALTDRECKTYTSMVVSNPREIFDAHTQTIDEMEYKVLVETKSGDIGFRNVNGVATTTLPEFDIRRFTPAIANPHIDVDVVLEDMMNSNPGAAGQMLMKMKASVIDGAYRTLGKQFYYGKSNNADGYEGLVNILSCKRNNGGKTPSCDLEFSAGGTTANKQSSIWLIAWGEMNASVIYGGGIGANFSWSELMPRLVQTANGEATHKWSYLRMYPMVAVSRPNCIARICNVESINDSKLHHVLAECEEQGFVPDCIYMRPAILETLRQSRTATTPTGNPAPTPEDVGGIPIHTTMSIQRTEAVVSGLTAI